MEYIRICPRCGCTDLLGIASYRGVDKTAEMLEGYKKGFFSQTAENFRCTKCDYWGSCPEILPSLVKDFRENLKKNKSK